MLKINDLVHGMPEFLDSRPIAIIAAINGEVKKLIDRIVCIDEGNIGDGKYFFGNYKFNNLVIVQSGPGISRARSAALAMVGRFSPRVIISTGSCGALEESIMKGDVVVGTEVILKRRGITEKRDYDTETFYPEITLTEEVYSILKESSYTVYQGRILSIGKFIYQPKTKQMLCHRYNAIAVEMECGGIAQIAREKKLPFIAVKVVSDELKERLVDYNRFADCNGNLIIKNVMPYFLLRPWDVFWALKFYNNLQRTYNRLYNVLDKIIEVI